MHCTILLFALCSDEAIGEREKKFKKLRSIFAGYTLSGQRRCSTIAPNIYRSPLAMSVCAAIAVSVKRVRGGGVSFPFRNYLSYVHTRVL